MRTELDDLYDDISTYLVPHWQASSVRVTAKVQVAIDFLTKFLNEHNGFAYSADIKRAAKLEGISEGMLTKARRYLRLVVSREDPPPWFAYGCSVWHFRCEGAHEWTVIDKSMALSEASDNCDPIEFDPYYACRRCQAPWPS
jgi:hypothetical protein